MFFRFPRLLFISSHIEYVFSLSDSGQKVKDFSYFNTTAMELFDLLHLVFIK